ncbi:hypothetical protein RHGRI_000637 [Rhododendron griersonianum]|uniref:Uncharacterized protein n=1 Tax=Rhododendron griersonianum TaxID=479676 RepID=A0AAV6LHG4_9ERIC|nr:hypothetical protein RHGRI_000637 [Rhododendron griersonianum]
MLEELAIVCGSDGATGEWCRGGPDINRRRAVDDSQFDIATDDNEIEDNGSGSDIYVTRKNDHGSKLSQNNRGKSSACPTPRQHGKRVRKSAALAETMNAIASSISQMAEAMERKTEIEAKKAKLNERVDPSVLLKTLEEIEGDHDDNNELGQEFQLQFVPVDTLVTPSRVQPSAEKWMTTPISNYDKLPEIFGEDRANGEGVDQMVSQNEATLENYINLDEVDMSSAKNESSSKKKRKRLPHGEVEEVEEIKATMQDSIGHKRG